MSRGVSQLDRGSEEPADLFMEEGSDTPSKSNGLNSDEDDLFAGQDTFVLTLLFDCALRFTVLHALAVRWADDMESEPKQASLRGKRTKLHSNSMDTIS